MITYRVGNQSPETVYRGDRVIGVMFTAEDAALVVEALNGGRGTGGSSEVRPRPTEPCGCMHYLGQQVVRCGGPHTVGAGGALRWAEQ